ncbi:hypothetical protein ACLB2K_024010 [Fragaria x ananassa]
MVGMIGAGFYAIWHARNALRFQELIILPGSLLHSIKMQLHEINFLSKGTMKNTVGELCILHRIGIKGRPSKAPKIVEVMWHVPSIYQVKLNTDGNLGIANALEAELQAVIHAIQMASQRDRSERERRRDFSGFVSIKGVVSGQIQFGGGENGEGEQQHTKHNQQHDTGFVRKNGRSYP